MPVTDDGFEQRSEDEIFEDAATELLVEEDDANPRNNDAYVNALLRSWARVLATNEEPALEDVYGAGFIESATDETLTRKARNLGFVRRDAQKATGVVTFESSEPVDSTFSVPSGTLVETVEDDPTQFETTEQTALAFLSGFESGNLSAWQGDTSSATITSTSSEVYDGTYAVELPKTDDVGIYRTDKTIRRGDTIHFRIQLGTDGIGQCLFLTEDLDNTFFIELDEDANTHTVGYVDGGSVTTEDTNTVGVGIPDFAYWDVAVKLHMNGDVTSTLTTNTGNEVDTITVTPSKDTDYEAGFGVYSAGANAFKWFDHISLSRTAATIEALEGGGQGNVGPNAITSTPSPVAGVSEVTNPQAVGDPTNLDTSGETLVTGRERESDSDLRDRVLDTDATHSGPTAAQIDLALENDTDALAVHVETNQTNGTVNGIDPYHTEVVVYGGTLETIVETLYDTMGVTSFLRLDGGANGTRETFDVESDLLDQTLTGEITRPDEVTMDVTIDVVHTSTYGGTNAVKDAIVRYVGGTRVDDNSVTGLLLGENVLINEVENRVEDVEGVDYANVTLVDTNDDTSDDSTTDSDGVPVLSIADTEIPRVDADDITVNETSRS